MASDMNKCTFKYLSLSSPAIRLVFFSNAEYSNFKNYGLLRSHCAYQDRLRSIIFVPWDSLEYFFLILFVGDVLNNYLPLSVSCIFAYFSTTFKIFVCTRNLPVSSPSLELTLYFPGLA